MKKSYKVLLAIISIIIIIAFIILGIKKFNSNTNTPGKVELTDTEIMQEAKLSLKSKYQQEYLYDNLSLVNYLEVGDYNYKVYIDWETSNNTLINVSSGKIYRDLNDHKCTITATFKYQDLEDKIDFAYTLPARKYVKTYPSYNNSKAGIYISLAYLAYDDKDNLSIKLYVYNNLDSKATITAINNLTFSISSSQIIFNYFSYLIKDYTYSNNNNNQFQCKYNDYVTITLPTISREQIISTIELGGNATPFLSITDKIKYTYAT